MGALSPWHLAIVLLAILLLSGYKKLPDASRSIGRSLRIFKGEMQGMKADDEVRTKDPATATPAVRGELVAAPAPAAALAAAQVSPPDAARLEEEARAAEAHAAELRARAEQARAGSADGPG